MPVVRGRLAEDVVDGGASPFLVVGPEVGVGVERLGRRRVAQASLDDLDRLAVADEERGVEVAEVLEAE